MSVGCGGGWVAVGVVLVGSAVLAEGLVCCVAFGTQETARNAMINIHNSRKIAVCLYDKR